MTIYPASLARVPNLLLSNATLSTLTRTNLQLFQAQTQLATGRAINRGSEDAARAATIAVLDDRLEHAGQLQRNLSHASAALDVIDNALNDATELALQSKQIALTQVGFSSSASEREGQAIVIDEMMRSLAEIANRQGVAGYLFGGTQTSTAPLAEFRNGYRFRAPTGGLTTDLGAARSVPITLGAGTAIGATSARVRGTVDLNPGLTLDTRLVDLNGARGLGIAPGRVRFAFNGATAVEVDLSGADSVRGVVNRLTASIREYESANSVTILGPGGIGVNGGALSFDLAPGTPPPELVFTDLENGTTAIDLGLTSDSVVAFTPGTPDGGDLAPKLTWLMPVSALEGLAAPLGSIRINNAGSGAVIDLSAAATLQDIRNAIEGANLGVRVEINAANNGLDILTEVSGGRLAAMSITDLGGGDLTASALGVRTFTSATAIADFNDGRGVRIVNGTLNPITGLPDPALDQDFTIVLGDGRSFPVDLRPQDIVSVQTVLARINGSAAAAGITEAEFAATLSSTTNGIVLAQDPAFGGAIRVEGRNNSPAASQLGLTDGAYNGATGVYQGTDRATVRPATLFTALAELREALRGNDTTGIGIAGERIEDAIRRLAETRGLTGSFARRVEDAKVREEDRATLDERIRSELRDADYTQVASRFALLQTQLQAGLAAASASNQQTLLDFLG